MATAHFAREQVANLSRATGNSPPPLYGGDVLVTGGGESPVSRCSDYLDGGSLASVLTAMREQPENSKMQCWGCGLLVVWARDIENHTKMWELDCFEVLRGTLEEQITDSNVTQLCCAVLAELTVSERADAEIRELGILDLVYEAAAFFPEDAAVLMSTFLFFQKCAVFDGCLEHLVDIGTGELIVEAMCEHLKSVEVQQRCCEALAALSRDEESGKIIGEFGGVAAVHETMRVHFDSVAVQQAACAAFRNLGTARANCKHMFALDSVWLVHKCMQQYRSDVALQRVACSVLQHLNVSKHDIFGIEIDGVLEAMRLYAHDLEMQQTGIATLRKLAVDVRHRSNINDMGGAELVQAAMWEHLGDAELQRHGLQALHRSP